MKNLFGKISFNFLTTVCKKYLDLQFKKISSKILILTNTWTHICFQLLAFVRIVLSCGDKYGFFKPLRLDTLLFKIFATLLKEFLESYKLLFHRNWQMSFFFFLSKILNGLFWKSFFVPPLICSIQLAKFLSFCVKLNFLS